MNPNLLLGQFLAKQITFHDILISVGAVHFEIDKNDIDKCEELLFLVEDFKNFKFSLSVENSSIIMRRNEATLELKTSEFNEGILIVLIVWHPTFLKGVIFQKTSEIKIDRKVDTIPVEPPSSLLNYIAMSTLTREMTYPSSEILVNKVISCLLTINDKIRSAGTYDIFWDYTRKGNSVISRTPKREVDIHPLITNLLSDQLRLASIDIIPEFKTGVGDCDFMLLGRLQDGETVRIMVEFKNMHSPDLEKGIVSQLPQYMRNQNADFGIYCVLDYYDSTEKLQGFRDRCNEVMLISTRFGFAKQDEIHSRIRVVILKLSKPLSASL